MGTPEFSLPSLEALLDSPWEVVGVVTQPDRPKGRGSKIQPSPIKQRALQLHLPVLQPEKIKDPDFLLNVSKISPHVIVVVAFGKILPLNLLQIPPLGCINLHASLLPKYRGAAPIQWALIHGETETGSTIILMNEGMDEGDILAQEKMNIGEEETYRDLSLRLANQGALLLVKTLKDLERKETFPQKQDHRKAVPAPSLKKQDGLIDWKKPASHILNLIRGTDPWPGAYTFLGPKRLRIWKASVLPEDSQKGSPGEIIKSTLDGIEVATQQGILVVKELQSESKKRMTVADFLAGHRIETGIILGSI